MRVWVEEAEHDLEVAAALSASGYHSHCAVSCEQGAEKLLKALWIYRHQKGPPHHSELGRLAESLGAPGIVVRASALLEPDLMMARYPDAALVPPYTRYDSATSADRLRAAGEVAQWVRERLADEGWA